jgi:hypothetical protein
MIGRSSIKKIERTAGKILASGDDAFASVTIYNDVPSDLERLVDDIEGALAALQEAQSVSGVPTAGPMLELWNRSDDEDDIAKQRATAIHTFALRRLVSQFRHSLATAKEDAEDQEAAVQVLESDEDSDEDMEL